MTDSIVEYPQYWSLGRQIYQVGPWSHLTKSPVIGEDKSGITGNWDRGPTSEISGFAILHAHQAAFQYVQSERLEHLSD